MGRKTKQKTKGKGAEKTSEKTTKNKLHKLKKELNHIGEADIEDILAEIEREEEAANKSTETVVNTPSRRVNFSLIAHPDLDQLILFGGEYFDGHNSVVYNDLLFYNITTETWTQVRSPRGPSPRCGHQMVATSARKGELWLFGGEFVSPTQSQYHHYRDLWVYHLHERRWEKIEKRHAPSARSGHRMVLLNRHLVMFGGFHDTVKGCIYYNDVHMFNTDTLEWLQIEVNGIPPAPRSACCMTAHSDGKVLIYGGYSKVVVKNDTEKGQVHTDAFTLAPEKNDQSGKKWRWSSLKIGGHRFQARCGMSMTSTSNQTNAYCFGGVFDTEDDESLSGEFFNDLLCLDLVALKWKNITLDRCVPHPVDSEPMETDNGNTPTTETIADDGIFKVTISNTTAQTPSTLTTRLNTNEGNASNTLVFPTPRMNCGLAIKRGRLYLYGGMVELGDKQITLQDMYVFDLRKMNEWKQLQTDDLANAEWLDSDDDSETSSSATDITTSDDDASDTNMESNQ